MSVYVQVPASPLNSSELTYVPNTRVPRAASGYQASAHLELIGGTALHKIFIRGAISEVNFKNGFSFHFHLKCCS